jgi:hypothetical protein
VPSRATLLFAIELCEVSQSHVPGRRDTEAPKKILTAGTCGWLQTGGRTVATAKELVLCSPCRP